MHLIHFPNGLISIGFMHVRVVNNNNNDNPSELCSVFYLVVVLDERQLLLLQERRLGDIQSVFAVQELDHGPIAVPHRQIVLHHQALQMLDDTSAEDGRERDGGGRVSGRRGTLECGNCEVTVPLGDVCVSYIFIPRAFSCTSDWAGVSWSRVSISNYKALRNLLPLIWSSRRENRKESPPLAWFDWLPWPSVTLMSGAPPRLALKVENILTFTNARKNAPRGV